jgi:hypothetical protein
MEKENEDDKARADEGARQAGGYDRPFEQDRPYY